jgi:hypothetical protein
MDGMSFPSADYATICVVQRLFVEIRRLLTICTVWDPAAIFRFCAGTLSLFEIQSLFRPIISAQTRIFLFCIQSLIQEVKLLYIFATHDWRLSCIIWNLVADPSIMWVLSVHSRRRWSSSSFNLVKHVNYTCHMLWCFGTPHSASTVDCCFSCWESQGPIILTWICLTRGYCIPRSRTRTRSDKWRHAFYVTRPLLCARITCCREWPLLCARITCCREL